MMMMSKVLYVVLLVMLMALSSSMMAMVEGATTVAVDSTTSDVVVAAGVHAARQQDTFDELIEWLQTSCDGYFNPNLSIQQANPLDANSRFAMFATTDIPSNQVLFEIPSKCLITSGEPNIDDYVTVNFHDNGEWFDGHVIKKEKKEVGDDILTLYSVKFNDGDVEENIPNSRIVKSQNPEIHSDGMVCSTINNLAKEMKLGEESFYKPYILDLLSQSSNQLPSMWSNDGKHLLRMLLGYIDPTTSPSSSEEQLKPIPVRQRRKYLLPPFDTFSWSYDSGNCNDMNEDEYEDSKDDDDSDDSDDDFIILSDEEKELKMVENYNIHNLATMIQVQRGWDDVIIPVFDMLSHRNGEQYLNTKNTPVHWSENVVVKSSRMILKGEEIYTSYNLCRDCQGRYYGYGTPEILRDYGFVEQYPQRWFFVLPGSGGGEDDNHEIAFEIVEKQDSKGDKDDQEGEGEEEEEESLELQWLTSTPPTLEGLQYLKYNLERMEKVTTESSQFQTKPESIPQNEYDTIKSYGTALMTAFRMAIQAIEDGDGVTLVVDSNCDASNEDTCRLTSDRYSSISLDEQEDNLPYHIHTCDNYERIFDFPGHTVGLEKIQTPYQLMNLFHDPVSLDTCFELDHTVQICGSYRPHYHEMVVHYTAKFLKEIKRVLWVGGGDSMLLHEIMKYNSTLEKVVGLEIDQTVTRKSFQHFGTQPHWNNHHLLEWWYGDAAKSLLMLPKDYYQSFDMVLVDLSETVMSMTVTEGLDIMGALSLLLEPTHGIMVKNELYTDQMSEIFEYAVQAHFYDVPVICSQALIFGSNGIDFLNTGHTDHPHIIDNVLWKDHLDLNTYDGDNKNKIWHDYRHNVNYKTSTSDLNNIEDIPTEQQRSPGILMILEVEDITVSDLDKSDVVRDIITSTLKQDGFHVLDLENENNDEKLVMKTTMPNEAAATSANKQDGTYILNVPFKEGYVIGRVFPQVKYIAFDIHLWTAFQKHDDIKNSLIKAFQGGSTDISPYSSSAYRIVAGGMFGMEHWKVDAMNKGPRIKSSSTTATSSAAEVIVGGEGDVATTSNTDNVVDDDALSAIPVPIDQETVNSVLSEMLILGLHGGDGDADMSSEANTSSGMYNKMTVAIFCGSETMLPCPSVDVMQNHPMVARVIPLYECPNLNGGGVGVDDEDDDGDDDNKANIELFECEKSITQKLKDETQLGKSKIRTIIIDPNASYNMGQIIHKIFSNPARVKAILTQPELLVVAPAILDDERWQRNLLDRFRRDFTPVEPVHLVEIEYTKFMDIDAKEKNKTKALTTATRKKSVLKMGFVSSGDEDLVEHVRELNQKIEAKQEEGGPTTKWMTDVKTMHGGRYRTQYGFMPTNFYLPTDYDQSAPLKQWMSQEPLGRQTLYQMEVQGAYVVGDRVKVNYKGGGEFFKARISNEHGDGTYDILYDDNDSEFGVAPFFIQFMGNGGKLPEDRFSELSSNQLADTISKTLKQAVLGDDTEEHQVTITTIDKVGGGDGSIVVALWSSGNLMAVWDGRRHVDFNLFTYDENESIHKTFEEMVGVEIPYLKTQLSDKQPRGYGRVVNFSDDVYVDENVLKEAGNDEDIHVYDDGNDDDEDEDDGPIRWIPHWSQHLFSLEEEPGNQQTQ